MLIFQFLLVLCSSLRGVRALAQLPRVGGVKTSLLGQSYHQRRFRSTEKRDAVPWGKGEAPDFGFAFDIDGVLLHESKPIPGATEVLKYLDKNKIPFILLTNGGGKREADRVADLSQKLDIDFLTTDNFVQSHTPFRELVHGPEGLENKTILVTGSNYGKCRDIAKSYGFKNVITPSDILAAQPHVFPFRNLNELHSEYEPLPKDPHTGDNHTAPIRTGLKVDAMFVFDDPRDWAVDIQIVMDLLLSHQGLVGTFSQRNNDTTLPNNGWQQDGQPALYFSNGDMVWSSKYHLPRFGQGAFQAALVGIWRRTTYGQELKRIVIGKPERETYRFAEGVMNEHHRVILVNADAPEPKSALRAVYMVGDNPDSDIAGANSFKSELGTKWYSALVKTGVWSEKMHGTRVLTGMKKPTVIVDDVRAAVAWACGENGWTFDY